MWTHRHQDFRVHVLPALKDNYIHLIEPDNAAALMAVDPAEPEPVVAACRTLGKPLTHVLITHHHWDHTGANESLKQAFGCRILGHARDAARIPGIDVEVRAECEALVGGLTFQVLDMPGHTLGHVAWLREDALFCGDVLFGAGCGRIFEGAPVQMWQSLRRLAALPPETRVYCAHEYTEANLRFAAHVAEEIAGAMGAAADERREAVAERMREVRALRAQGLPSVPFTIGGERKANPFLWPLDEGFRQGYARLHGLESGDELAVFTHLRARKDIFRG